jgi:soluble lytic murein transglycosylase-like protein
MGLLVAQSYISYKYPIKQDLYGHLFRTNQANRILAYSYLLKSGHKFGHYDVDQINEIIDETAGEYGVDPDLLKAITMYESYYLFTAISTTGAMGLMALMPETARRNGVRDPFDPRDNIAGGAKEVKMLSEEFHGDFALILAGYNAGGAAVKRFNGVPPFAETLGYVSNVSRIYYYLKGSSHFIDI